MRVAHVLILGLTCLSFASVAQAQDQPMPTPPTPPQDALLDARVGTWQGTGTMMDMPMTQTDHSDWALGHHFFITDTTMTGTMPDGSSLSFEMRFITKPNGDGTSSGIVIDSWGMMDEYTGRTEEGSLVYEWNDDMTGMNMRAIETPAPDGGFVTTFFMQEGENWVECGSVTFARTQG